MLLLLFRTCCHRVVDLLLLLLRHAVAVAVASSCGLMLLTPLLFPLWWPKNTCADVEVGDWEVEPDTTGEENPWMRRIIRFSAPVKLPSVVARMMNVDVARCCTQERKQFVERDDVLHIAAENTVQDVPMASKCHSRHTMRIYQEGRDVTVQVHAVVEFTGSFFLRCACGGEEFRY